MLFYDKICAWAVVSYVHNTPHRGTGPHTGTSVPPCTHTRDLVFHFSCMQISAECRDVLERTVPEPNNQTI